MKSIFVNLFIVFSLVSFAQNTDSNPGFEIVGKITSIPENSFVYLSGFSGADTLAKGKVVKGAFSLKGNLQTADACIINFPALQKRIVLFLGNDRVLVNGSREDFSDIVVSGSVTNYQYEEFLYHIKPLNDYANYFRSQVQQAETQAAHDSAVIMLNTAYNIYQQSIDQFIARKNSSPVASLVLAYSYDMDPNKDISLVEKRFNTLTGDAVKSLFAKNLQQVIENDKIGAVGTKAIDFTQTDTAGIPVSLAQFKGKYVLVDFWASWCGPCRKENPNVVAAFNEFKDKNFTILGVSLDQDKGKWLAAIQKDNLTWSHISDLQYFNNAVARIYNINSIPANILVAPDGTIIAKDIRGTNLQATLKNFIR